MTVLELGAGANPTPGAVHHDRIKHADYIDEAHDLDRLPWPWADESVDELLAFDVFEHLRLDVAEWLNECHRIIRPGGLLKMRLPAWDNMTSYTDPTHRHVFTPDTFDYWDPERWYHQHFGRFYFAETPRWWRVESVFRHIDNTLGPYEGVGDLRFDLRRLA